MIVLSLFLAVLGSGAGERAAPHRDTRTIRVLDLDGDGHLDRLQVRAEGTLEVALNRGGRQFEPIAQSLPPVVVSDVLATDLDGDGHLDLYLVSPGPNVALLGDGLGGFVPATQALGLQDTGEGLGAERVDVDEDGIGDVLLHDRSGDVIFWGSRTGTYERDASTPEVALPAPAAAPVATASVTPALALTAPTAAGGATRASAAASPAAPPVAAGQGTAAGRALPSGPPAAPPQPLTAALVCTKRIEDQSTGNCILADSIPTFGRLLPIGSQFYVSPIGRVGIGTTDPQTQLEVTGDIRGAHLFVLNNKNEIHRGKTGAFGQADLHTFDPVTDGIVVENGEGLQSGGFFANGNTAAIWSPGDTQVNSFTNVVLAVFDQDNFGTIIDEPEFVVSGPLGVQQPTNRTGLVKAAVSVNGIGTATITRSINVLPGGTTPVLTDLGTGAYAIDFGVDVSQRYYVAVLGTGLSGNATNGTIDVAPRALNANAVFISTGSLAGSAMDNEFYVLVY